MELVDSVKEHLEYYYNSRVHVLNPIDHSHKNFVNIKSPRYRADSIIRDLRRAIPDSVNYILGFTSRDISITKQENGKTKKPISKYNDWGVFGLGYRPGKACIVSTFRLGKNANTIKNRTVKISLHEIGHNKGLKHCPNNCVMKDAAESIKTIDNVPAKLCDDCWKKVK